MLAQSNPTELPQLELFKQKAILAGIALLLEICSKINDKNLLGSITKLCIINKWQQMTSNTVDQPQK